MTPALDRNFEAARFTVRQLALAPLPQDRKDRAAAISLMMARVARGGIFMRRLDGRDLLPGLAGVPFRLNIGTDGINTPVATAGDLASR